MSAEIIAARTSPINIANRLNLSDSGRDETAALSSSSFIRCKREFDSADVGCNPGKVFCESLAAVAYGGKLRAEGSVRFSVPFKLLVDLIFLVGHIVMKLPKSDSKSGYFGCQSPYCVSHTANATDLCLNSCETIIHGE
jgi:hypothetical protein